MRDKDYEERRKERESIAQRTQPENVNSSAQAPREIVTISLELSADSVLERIFSSFRMHCSLCLPSGTRSIQGFRNNV